MNEYMQYIALSRYARWLPEENRRETWDETVQRYAEFFEKKSGGITSNTYVGDGGNSSTVHDAIFTAIHNLDVMPSMRCMMTAGEALERDNVAGFNCSYLAINRQRAFDELMYILLCGTGVGFSCERQEIQKLPYVAEEMHETDTTIVVADSKIGWASAYRELISLLYSGKIPKWDLSKIRPAGAPLKTFGGRASGPAPLEELFNFTVSVFKKAVGRKLNSLEVHDVVCKIAAVVVVGGVRRSALISLSNLSDPRMQKAKYGDWYNTEGQRALANNSVCYTEKPDVGIYIDEMRNLYESKSGERGIFNRTAAKKQAAKNGRRDAEHDFGCNPCSEIILRDRQVCNLSEVVVRPGDTFDRLKQKVIDATILGTLQATLTDFRYLSRKWKENTEEEALLGVSLTGIMDHPILSGRSPIKIAWEGGIIHLEQALEKLREVAIETNKEWAKKLGINQSTAITCVKPSGTVSQLVDCASGIHPRYSPFYVRTVRADRKDPLAQMMIDMGFPYEDDITNNSNYVFSFPMKAPSSSVMRDDITAIEQLDLWLIYQDNWCEHKPSMTCYVKEEEWPDVFAWVYRNFDKVSGISFLPHTDHVYQQAPYQEISEAEYNELVKKMPKDTDWAKLGDYETYDQTISSQEYACTGGSCEVL